MPKHNKDGKVNCLHTSPSASYGRVGSPENLIISEKHLCEKPHHNLLKYMYRDNSCYLEKINRAASPSRSRYGGARPASLPQAGTPAAVSVFASSFSKFNLDE